MLQSWLTGLRRVLAAPAVAAGALASVRHLKQSQFERQAQQDRVRLLKRRLGESGTNTGGDFGDAHWLVVLSLTAVRQSDHWHRVHYS